MGNLAPWSFHNAVIPRLRAIRPVRKEFGVHFGGDWVSIAAEVLSGAAECMNLLESHIGGRRPWQSNMALTC